MEDIRTCKVNSFDTTFTNNHICMFKVLLPFLPASLQGNLAIYIKYMELQYTMQYFKKPSNRQTHSLFPTNIPSPTDTTIDFNSLFEELLPYSTPSQKQHFTQIRNMLETMRNIQDMMEILETMKEFFPEGMGNQDGETGSFNPEILAAMSSMFGGGMDINAISDYFSGGDLG